MQDIYRDMIRDKVVGVLAGGLSSERDISIKSGRAVYDSLLSSGAKCKFMDIVNEDIREIRSYIAGSGIDIAFIALHGRFGEDGTVQALLEEMNMPYTGSGPDSSRLAFDKLETKRILENSGICVPRYRIFREKVFSSDDNPFFPAVVKPAREGSSMGMTVLNSEENLREAVNKALRHDDTVIVEEFINGIEVTVGILDDQPLPVVEIRSPNSVYDYEAKYVSSRTQYIVPAALEQSLSERVQQLGLKVHKTIGCRSLSRVDMMIRDSVPYVLEINTIPGLTGRSLLPKAAECAGVGFDELCLRILKGAFVV